MQYQEIPLALIPHDSVQKDSITWESQSVASKPQRAKEKELRLHTSCVSFQVLMQPDFSTYGLKQRIPLLPALQLCQVQCQQDNNLKRP